MKYILEFRGREEARRLADRIRSVPLARRVTLMEVCGSHTMAIHRFGIRDLLPEAVNLISGPGCPVCVTDMAYIDRAVAIGRRPGVLIATFGDMMKVPGSRTSLSHERAAGGDVRVVYSTLDALEIARRHPDRQVVFLGIGFETTAPTIAAAVQQARRERVPNFSVLVAHKLIPPAMEALARDPAVGVHGYLCPAHVSAVIGANAYAFLPARYGVACAVVGFEPLDILQGIYLLLRQVVRGAPTVENEYSRVVRPDGNLVAQRLLAETFQPCDDRWRGIGLLPGSGLALRDEFAEYDAARRFPVELEPVREPAGCRCGDILKGICGPTDCPLFGTGCTPENPVGACMVSSEGTCAAWYKYRRA
jgi:hydrogenase expression/formation protein HypD